MKTKTFILTMIVVFIALGSGVYIQNQNRPQESVTKSGHHDKYHCPMHPQIIYDHPGRCPICGMDLVKIMDAHPEQGSKIEGYATVAESIQRQQLIGLRTQVVEVKPIVKMMRAVGTVDSALELYQTQNEFIDAFVAYVNVHRDYQRINDRSDTWGIHRDLQTRLLEAQDKLLKLGLSMKEIATLKNVSWSEIRKQPKLLMFNDSRAYWVMAQIFEQDLNFIKENQQVEVTIPAFQQKFKGMVRSIGGLIDPISRTASVLIELVDCDQPLAANILVDISIPVTLKDTLTVPRQAVMDTGVRKIVFVSKDGNAFEPREIKSGLETDDELEVKSGLSKGERIVVNGNFLLDSESRVQASLQQEERHE